MNTMNTMNTKQRCADKVLSIFQQVTDYYERLHDKDANIIVPPVRSTPEGIFAFTHPYTLDRVVGKILPHGRILWMARLNTMTHAVTLTNISIDQFLSPEGEGGTDIMVTLFADSFQRILTEGGNQYDPPLTIAFDGSMRRIQRSGVWSVTHDTANYGQTLKYEGIDERTFFLHMTTNLPDIHL